MAEVAENRKLNSGHLIPTVGLGTWTMFNNPEGQMKKVIETCIKGGYRHIDTAKVYGTEPLIGPALKEIFELGEVSRNDIFITCKIWNSEHHPDDVKASIKQSLADLQTDYIDLVLIHWPMAYKPGPDLFPKDADGNLIYADVDYVDTWKALEECVESGLVRSIGVSNFNIDQLKRVLDSAKIKPCTLQVELNAYFNNQELADFCQENEMLVTCYAPFGNPNRTWAEEGEPNLLEDPDVLKIAEELDRTPAQVLLRFLMQKGYVVLPKSVTESRIISNFQVFDFSLSEENMDTLNALNRNLQVYKESDASTSPYYPF